VPAGVIPAGPGLPTPGAGPGRDSRRAARAASRQAGPWPGPVSPTWVWYLSQGTKTPVILKELPGAGLEKDKGIPAASRAPVAAVCPVLMGSCLPDRSLPVPAS